MFIVQVNSSQQILKKDKDLHFVHAEHHHVQVLKKYLLMMASVIKIPIIQKWKILSKKVVILIRFDDNKIYIIVIRFLVMTSTSI